jgi:hypothetical protein
LDSIRINRVLDSNEIDVSDLDPGKYDEPGISTLIGITTDSSDEYQKARDLICVNRERILSVIGQIAEISRNIPQSPSKLKSTQGSMRAKWTGILACIASALLQNRPGQRFDDQKLD